MSYELLIPFFTLFALELVLGIDNIIFISILAGKLPADQQNKARQLGLGLAVITRILLLLSLSWVIGLTEPILSIGSVAFSGRDLILVLGGLFLIAKSTLEIHHKLEGVDGSQSSGMERSFIAVIVQILLLDIVFSLDSVITAVGMVNHVGVMISAVILSTLVMIFTSGFISQFVEKHPTLKILALSFLLMIGFTLLVEGFGQHVSKFAIYFAMGFSVLVESLNIRFRAKSLVRESDPVQLRERIRED